MPGPISAVSTANGPRDLASIWRIADTTSETAISLMHRRSYSHVFDRQHGAHGTAE